MRVTAILSQTPRNRLDKYVRRAEKHFKRPRTTPPLGLKHPQPDVCAVRSEVTLDRTASSGHFFIQRQTTWGMSVDGYHVPDPRAP